VPSLGKIIPAVVSDVCAGRREGAKRASGERSDRPKRGRWRWC